MENWVELFNAVGDKIVEWVSKMVENSEDGRREKEEW